MQIGLWFIALQSVLEPQDAGHADMHLKFLHILSRGHSELVVHSGLHSGGDPRYPVAQVQIATPFCDLHWLFGPHGVGLQGSVISSKMEDQH